MRNTYVSPREKRIDLWLGFAGWLILTAAALLLAISLGSGAGRFLALALIPATIAAAVFFGVTRAYAARGIGLALVAVVGLVAVEIPFFVLGLFLDVLTGGPHTDYCAKSQGLCVGPPVTAAMLIVGLAVFLFTAVIALRAIHLRIREPARPPPHDRSHGRNTW